MRQVRGWTGLFAAAWVLAACGPEGGELRQATREREAALALGDTLGAAADTLAVPLEVEDVPEVPVFADEVPPVADTAAAPAPPAADTASAAPAPPAAAPRDTARWTAGVTRERRPPAPPGILSEIRTARHEAFDRVVFTFAGERVPSYRIEYVDSPVHQCGSGEPTPIAGDGQLSVSFTGARAHDARGRATVSERERKLSLPVLREVEITCDFEGEVTAVLGVAAPNRYRVLELSGPTRLVVDVRH